MRKIPAKNGGFINLLEKGETANPNGRPPGPNFKTAALKILSGKKKLKDPITGKVQQFTGMEMMALKLVDIIASTRKNDFAKIAAIKELVDRLEGKVSQSIDLSVEQKARDIASMFPTEEELKLLTDGTDNN